MKYGYYVRHGHKVDMMHLVEFNDDNTLRHIHAPQHFSTINNGDVAYSETPEIMGYKGPIDPTTGNTMNYERMKREELDGKNSLEIYFSDRMESNKVLFWSGYEMDEYLEQLEEAKAILNFFGTGPSHKGKNYTHKIISTQ